MIAGSAAESVLANDLTYSSTASGSNHFIDLYNFEASYSDLIAAFGANETAMQNWYNSYEPVENPTGDIRWIRDVASYSDLISAFATAGSLKAVQDDGALHYIFLRKEGEGRTTSSMDLIILRAIADLINRVSAPTMTMAPFTILNMDTKKAARRPSTAWTTSPATAT